MLAKVFSAAIVGLDANIVEVEVDVSQGLRSFSIVGLPDKTVEESKERIASAIKSSKLLSPHQRTFKILVNLAPADLKKEGSWYDLPIALAFLVASKQAKPIPQDKLFVGELSLDGNLRRIRGALSLALLCKQRGIAELIVPSANAPEASLVKGIDVVGVQTLYQALAYLEKRINKESLPSVPKERDAPLRSEVDIAWVKGQAYAKRALEITAAGAHNLFLSGPPGSGKTHLACAISHELIRRNLRLYFVSCQAFVQQLLIAKRDLTLNALLKRMDKYDAILIDDLGYVYYTKEEMDVFFAFFANRYERKSVILTSNLPFNQWESLFKDPISTAAAIDRLIHHCIIVEMNLPSYRLAKSKEKKELNIAAA